MGGVRSWSWMLYQTQQQCSSSRTPAESMVYRCMTMGVHYSVWPYTQCMTPRVHRCYAHTIHAVAIAQCIPCIASVVIHDVWVVSDPLYTGYIWALVGTPYDITGYSGRYTPYGYTPCIHPIHTLCTWPYDMIDMSACYTLSVTIPYTPYTLLVLTHYTTLYHYTLYTPDTCSL